MQKVTASQRKNGTYEAKGIDPITGKRKSYYAKEKHEAERKAIESLSFKDDRTLAGFYFGAFLSTIEGRSRAWQDQVAYFMEHLVLPTFGHEKIDQIKRAPVQEAFIRWSKLKNKDGSTRFKEVTLRKAKIVFSRVMNVALDDELIQRNPVARVSVFGEKSKPKIALSAEELFKLYKACDDLSRPVVILAGFCSLRIGEATGVMRSAIDDFAVLEVRQQVLQQKGGCVISQTLKTEHSHRFIPLPEELFRVLLNCRQVSDIFLCSDTRGGYITPNNATRSLQAACKRAGIRVISPHALRHTFISLMENELGCPSSIVAELSGKVKQGPMGNYSHARAEKKRVWMEELWKMVHEAEKLAEIDRARFA